MVRLAQPLSTVKVNQEVRLEKIGKKKENQSRSNLKDKLRNFNNAISDFAANPSDCASTIKKLKMPIAKSKEKESINLPLLAAPNKPVL